MEDVKSFVKNYSSSKVSFRVQLLVKLLEAIKSRDIAVAPAIVKPLVLTLTRTLFYYNDSRSRALVCNILEELMAVDGQLVSDELYNSLLESSKIFRNSDRVSLAKTALIAYKWISLSPYVSSSQIEIYANTLTCIVLSNDAKIISKSERILLKSWTRNPTIVVQTIDAVLQAPPSYQSLPLINFGARFCHKNESLKECWSQKKVDVLKYYSKAVFSCRTLVPELIVLFCSDILRDVTHKEFSEHLFQPASKCLLRNPDELMKAVSCLFLCLSLDCSRYAIEFLKASSGQLCSSTVNTRQDTITFLQRLSSQCSDTEVCINISQYLLDMLMGKGPTGKLSNVEHRQAVLNSINSLAKCPLTSNGLASVSATVVEGLLIYLKQEAHGPTQLVTIATIESFCDHFQNEIPKNLLAHLKSSLEGKATPPGLRLSYWYCLDKLWKGENNNLITKYMSLITQCIEKAKVGGAQIGIIEEGVVLSWLLVSRSASDIDTIGPALAKLMPFLDGDAFLSSKFLSTAEEKSLQCFIELATVLLVTPLPGQQLKSPNGWVSAVTSIALTKSWSLHEPAVKCLKFAMETSEDLPFHVLEILCREMKDRDDEITDREIKSIVSVLLSVSILSSQEKKENFLRKSFLLCHHPKIFSLTRNGPWLKQAQKLSLMPAMVTLLPSLATCLLENVVNQPQTCHLGVVSLSRVCGSDFIEQVIKKMSDVLGNEEIVQFSINDLEIAATSPNQLWNPELNKLLIESQAGQSGTTNIKREGKTYSYEDQVWDRKMKEETARRKRLNSETLDVHDILKESQLTQKKKEAILNELKLEETIRNRVNALSDQMKSVLMIFKTLLSYNKPVLIQTHLLMLIKPVLASIESPLGKSYCIELWEEICKVTIQDIKTALLFCWTSLHLLAPKITPPTYWSTPSLTDSVNKLLPALPTSYSINTDVVWSLCLPMIKSILINNVESINECVNLTLKTFSTACQSHKSLDKFGHDLFPVADALRLLGVVISSKATPLKSIKTKKLAIDGFRSLIVSINDQDAIDNTIIDTLVNCISDNDDLLRQTSLRCMETLGHKVLLKRPRIQAALLVTCNDSNSENSVLAKKLWDVAGFAIGSTELVDPLFDLLTEPTPEYIPLLMSTAKSLGQWLTENNDYCNKLYDRLSSAYLKKRKAPPPMTDSFGRTIVVEYKDAWEGRLGVAYALGELPVHMTAELCMEMLKFMIPLCLSDSSNLVRTAMIDASSTAISQHGESLSSELMSHFETCLNKLSDDTYSDTIHQALVVLMGSLAKHLSKDDPKVKTVFQLLLTNLDTPSQAVQQSIANCLVPLAPSIRDDAETIISQLLNKLFESTVYSQRRGAAYGLAGIIKGLGIPALKQYNITNKLQNAINDKKNFRQREGGLFGFEAFCDMLGKLFEPYVVHLLPDLLLCFGDGNQYVREAANMTAKTIMTNLSSHGVKLVLPSLLSALEQDSWRTKAGSAELLGAMAYCAPRQLSTCLPSIVPRIMEVLTDSHSKVQQAGSQALQQIGSVIKSPEIQPLVPLLLAGLNNPSGKAQKCLQALLDTEFEHKVDPPSLALIMPTVKRALELRSADSKKMAAKVIAELYNVTDKKDLTPYLKDVLPGLKQSLTDPLPEVRSSSAKALGAMVQGVGEEGLRDVWPWLLKTLQSEATPVDRSGAAQAIAEVIKAQGVEQLDQLMPRFVMSSQDLSTPTHCRDGFLMLFIYLPLSFEDEFIRYIDRILPPILKGLADESEYIRDTSLLAAQTIINSYADRSVDLFLPQLEKGLLHDNWRIRCSSVQLLGDLLFCISGQSGKMSTESEEDDNFATEAANQSIIDALGVDKRNKILAGLYIGRSDVAVQVRQSALHVWKLVVSNTARTLRDILPTLIDTLLSCLACDNYDKRQVAAHTLGDLVRKLGERVLPEIFPMLEKGLKSDCTQERQGVCIGLSEIIKETSREYMQAYSRSLIPLVRTALCDTERDVRIAAAKTFDSLHTAVGQHVLEEILTPLLIKLGKSSDDERRDIVLDGLQQIMSVKSNVVLPMVIPQLIQTPVNVRALSVLSSVAGHALYKHLPRVIPALVSSLAKEKEVEENIDAAVGVVLSVGDEPGVSILIEELFKCGRANSDNKRAAAMMLMEAFCSKSTADLSEHIPQLLVFAAESLTNHDQRACEKAWLALDALVTKVIPNKELPDYIGHLHKALNTCQNIMRERKEDELNGFNIKGISSVLTMLKEGLVAGSQDNKEESARCLILVIHMSSPSTLTAGRVVMAIAGPLIRVLGDRYGWNVKVAVLETLVELVRKVGIAAKAFIPQLQTSYLKALNDPNSPVRNQAVIGIVELVMFSPRVDPVFNDIHNGIKKNEDASLRNTLLEALSGILKSVGNRMNDKYKLDIQETLLQLQHTAHEGNRLLASSCLGILCNTLNDDQLIALIQTHLVNTSSTSDWALLQAKGTALSSAITYASERMISCGLQAQIEEAIIVLASSDRVPVCITGLDCIASFINRFQATPPSFLIALTDNMGNTSMDIRQATCEICGRIKEPSDIFVRSMVGPLLVSTKDKNTAVKSASERALVDLLDLANGEDKMKYYMSILDGPIARRLEECHSRVLSKIKT